jgi:hypothetical protein
MVERNEHEVHVCGDRHVFSFESMFQFSIVLVWGHGDVGDVEEGGGGTPCCVVSALVRQGMPCLQIVDWCAEHGVTQGPPVVSMTEQISTSA